MAFAIFRALVGTEAPVLAQQLENYDSFTDYLLNDTTAATLVEDMSAQAASGTINRAYERESLMQELISAIAQGVVILQGPPGSGKTALFEELSYRVYHQTIPTFKKWNVVRLKLKQLKGDGSVEGKINRVLDGGVSNRFQQLLKYVQRKHAQSTFCIILIDEIQDLLEGNITIFDSYKEELARQHLHIVGATTNKEVVEALRKRGGSGVGMERRIGVIELQEMSPDETVKVIAQRAQNPSKSKVQFGYTDDFALSIVTLAKSRYPEKIFPDCAVCLFEDVQRFYFDKNLEQKSKTALFLTLTSQHVVDYLALISNKPKDGFSDQVKHQIDKATFHAGFADRFFPCLKPPLVSSPWIEPEAARLEIFFRKSTETPFLFLKGESDYFLTQVATLYGQQKEVIYCDVAELVKHVNATDGRQLMQETLQRRMRLNPTQTLLILKNFNPKWISTPTPKTEGAKSEKFVHKAENNTAHQILQQVSSTLGMGPIPSVTTTSEPPRQTKILPLIEELMRMIEREKIPTVVTLSTDANLKREQWTLFEVQPLTIDQTIEWLEAQFSQKKDSIRPILAAFYYLKDPSISSPVVELTVQTLAILQEDCSKAMFEVLGGFKPLKEIQTALETATAGMNEEWSYIVEPSHTSSQSFPDVPPQSILWIAENSHRRREWISLQIAAFMKTLRCFWYHPSFAWREMPGPLKEQLLQKFLQPEGAKQDKLIFITEADLQDETLQKMLRKNSSRVVCFYTPKPTPAPDLISSLPSMSPLLEQGKAFLQNLNPPRETPSKTPTLLPECELTPLHYTPPPLTLGEQKQILSLVLEGTSESAKSHILPLYLLLCEKTNSFDETTRRLEQDMTLLKTKSTDQIYHQFTEFYGKELKMSLQDIQYAINPALSSLSYRCYRFIFTTLNALSTPFRWMKSYITEIIESLFIGRMVRSQIGIPKNPPPQ